MTVYLCAPPGDGLSVAREHFRDYIKPVLNAAAVDFDVVEGREMGEVRAKVAEGVRRRRRDGWGYEVVGADGGEGGVIAVGRTAWKEWTRGIQEGWFGPLEKPQPAITEVAAEAVEKVKEVVVETLDAVVAEGEGEKNKDGEEQKKEEEKKKEEEEEKKPRFEPEFILPAEYPSATLPSNIPAILPPAGIVSFPHILGFLNTPIRLYRFLNRRAMAEEVCKEAAAVALGNYRPFIVNAPEPEGMLAAEEQVEHVIEDADKPHETEIEGLLKEEEKDWLKKVWKEERYVGVWRDPLTVDERIKMRMRRFFLPTEAEMEVQKAKEAGSNEW